MTEMEQRLKTTQDALDTAIHIGETLQKRVDDALKFLEGAPVDSYENDLISILKGK